MLTRREPVENDVPDGWTEAAEEVRAHLCALRGGAPFLSPMDAWQLVRWLEEGVSVAAILLALERAADARRRSRSRTPLSLVAARRHLGRPVAGAFARALPSRRAEPPLAALVRALRAVPIGTDRAARAALEPALLEISGRGEVALRPALAAVRTFLETAWSALGAAGQEALAAEAREELGDLLGLVEEGTAAALVEETARDRLRGRYPALTAATLRELCGDDDPS
jgi:hypothetical protein